MLRKRAVLMKRDKTAQSGEKAKYCHGNDIFCPPGWDKLRP
jgi:hypothetical protein